MRATSTDGIEGLAGYRPLRQEPGWRDALIRNTQGAPKALLANAVISLRTAPEWKGVLAYNSFAQTTTLAAPPPWLTGANDWQSRPWASRDDVLTTDWLQHNGIAVGVDVTQAAVEAVAQDAPFHPVQDYLAGVRWDGQPRIGTWLQTYLGAEGSPYTDAVGQAFLISAIARALNPGCKVDTMPIFEGAQGVGKSAAKIPAHQWFTDEIADLGSRDASMQVAGVWIAEISELDAMSRGEVAKIKAFLSRTTDRYRPPYGRRVIEVPRSCVFIGTTNSDGYLKDETGGRRFWPVPVRSLNLDRLDRDRDQLWAEGVVQYGENAPWWLDHTELVRAADEEQAARYLSDPWHNVVASSVAVRASIDITEILTDVLFISRDRWTQVEQNRVARILKSLGFTRKQIRDGRERKYRYVREAGP